MNHLGEGARVQVTARQALSPLILSLATMAVLVTVLFGVLDYAQGYGDIRESVIAYSWRLWTSLEDWNHCMLVPFAAGFIVYLNRKRLAELPLRGTWVGLPIVLVSFCFYWFGYQADIIYCGYISMQLMLAGLILLFFGWQWMGVLAFPWLFLAFMWPMLFLDNMLAFPLRVIMSKASVIVLNTVGVPSVLSGTAILSAPDALTGRQMGKLFSVDVAEPCSGIRSLFALMMVSALYGYFAVKGWWRRWVVFLTSIPLAILGNLCRIVMLTFGTIAMGADVAIGTIEDPSFFHMLSGYVVFAVALGGMLLVGKLLNIDWAQLYSRFHVPPPPPSDRPSADVHGQPGKVQDIY